MVLATLVVTVLPGLVAAALRATEVIHGWLPSAAVAVALSMALAAAGSVWWARRPMSRDIVFADLMVWGWLRRVRTERRLASARWLLGRSADLDPARKAALLERLSGALESRDLYTHGHSRRVTRHTHRIARQLGLSAADAARVRTAAALHDVGKIETPRALLNKPGRLTDEELRVMQRHAEDGARMVAELGDDELTAIVRHHHERLDGSGYPDGLIGGAIPLGARIIAVTDTFDALTSSRPYRSGCRHKKALDVLRAAAGTKLDPDVVAAFLSYYSGRRVMPWWSAVAEGPRRLATWMLSGLQGATAAPLGGGAGSLGAAFLVGVTLAGSPVGGEATRAADASADAAPVAARSAPAPDRAAPPVASDPVAAGPGRTEPARRGGGTQRIRERAGRPRGERLLRSGPVAVTTPGVEPVGVPSPGGAEPGAGGSGGGDPGPRLPEVAVPKPVKPVGVVGAERPVRVTAAPKEWERAAEAPRALEDPSVRLSNAELPRVELPRVDVPGVEPPKVTVPNIELPKVEVPLVDVHLEPPTLEAPEVQLPRVEGPLLQLP